MARLAVELLEGAKADFRMATAWYRETAGIRTARQFAVSVEKGPRQLSLHPQCGPIFRETVRRLFLGKFPYWVYYTEDGETILVVAILHAKRDETDFLGNGN